MNCPLEIGQFRERGGFLLLLFIYSRYLLDNIDKINLYLYSFGNNSKFLCL